MFHILETLEFKARLKRSRRSNLSESSDVQILADKLGV
jgi:hypothetical protein